MQVGARASPKVIAHFKQIAVEAAVPPLRVLHLFGKIDFAVGGVEGAAVELAVAEGDENRHHPV